MQFDLQTQKKHQVDLSEYNSTQDLFYRNFLTSLEPEHTLHLIELFYLSAKTTLPKLKNALDLTDEDLKHFLDAIAPLKILSIEGDVVLVDKEVKKHVECFLEKFTDEFSPGIEYFQSLLRQVPIQILPNWYALPRSCESIFQSLKDRIFATPTLYLRHLQDIESPNFDVQRVIRALLNSPTHSLTLAEVTSLIGCSKKELDQHLFFLEFQFAAVVCHENLDGTWISILKLPVELSQYLRERSVCLPFTSLEQNQVRPDRGVPLTFAFDLSQAIRFAKMTPVRVTEQNGIYQFDPNTLAKMEGLLHTGREHIERVLQRSIELKLLMPQQGFLSLYSQTEQWLLYSLEKQALSLYKALWIQGPNAAKQAEKGLAALLQKGWILESEVLRYVSHGKPSLQRGRDGFVYELADEIQMTAEFLETLFESGIIEWGTYLNQRCLRLTELGSQICS